MTTPPDKSSQPNASADQPTVIRGPQPKPPTAGETPQQTKVTNVAAGSGPGLTQVTQIDASTKAQPVEQRQRPSQHGTQVTALNVETGISKTQGEPGTHHNQQWGDFLIGTLLGKGGMGSVYRGKQVSLDRPVAIKVLPPHLSQNEGFRARFGIEAKAVAAINSQHVIQVYAAGQHEGHHYFAMEYIEGEDLSVKLRKGWRPTHRESLELIRQAARGLAAAGELGIIHRDIKPANMMLTKKGVLKLMDFGLAKLAASGETGLTMAGTIMGTVSYFSPEQGRGEVCDQRTDVYALGVVFYELLTGKLPFTGQDATSIIYQHIHQPPRAPKEIDPNIPEYYQGVVLKCMQKQVVDRYQSATDLLADLDSLAEGRSPNSAFTNSSTIRSGADVVRGKPFSNETAKGSRLFIGVAVAAILIGGGVWFATRPPQVAAAPGSTAISDVVAVTPVAPAEPLVPVVISSGPGKKAMLSQVRNTMDGGGFTAARRQAQAESRANPQDKEWLALLEEIDRSEGMSLLKAAQTAFGEGDLDKAITAAATARDLIPDSAELIALQDKINSRGGAAKQRNTLLKEAQTLLREGQAERAESILVDLAAQLEGDEEVAKELRVARKAREDHNARNQAIAERLADAEAAVQRKEYDSALLAYNAALGFDPGCEKASLGLAMVNQVKQKASGIRDRFSLALKNRDLVAAEKELAELRATVPGSTTLVLAETELNNSKLVEDEARKHQAELEAKMSAQARAVLQVIEDPKSDIAQMEQSLKAFLSGAGVDRPERADLEKRVEDKRQLKRVQDILATLDKAMLAKDAAALRGVIKDEEFASALTELQRYQGMIFESRIDEFTRDGEQAVAKISLRHALTVFPERLLNYTFKLRQDGGGWTVVGAKLNP